MLHKNVAEESDSGVVDQRLTSRGNLPHWTRLNTLEMARYPRPFEKDQQALIGEPVAPTSKSTQNNVDENPGNGEDLLLQGETKNEAGKPLDQNSIYRLRYLEKSLELLKKQHREILRSLHQEIDDLKRQNKDLNFRIVMSHCDSTTMSPDCNDNSCIDDIYGVGGEGAASNHTGVSAERTRGRRDGKDDIVRDNDGDGNDDDEDNDCNNNPSDNDDGDDGGDGDEKTRGQRVRNWQRRHIDNETLAEEDTCQTTYGDTRKIADPGVTGQVSDRAIIQLHREAEKQHRILNLDKAGKLEELKMLLLEEELRKLQPAFQEVQHRNGCLSRLLEQSEDYRRQQALTIQSLRYQLVQYNRSYQNDPKLLGAHLVTQQCYDQVTQHMSILELQKMVKHLQQVNDCQSHELEALKSDLRDVLYSHKWTPDAYLIAKAYIAVDDAKFSQRFHTKAATKRRSTPKLFSRKELKEHGSATVSESLTLPPLKQTVGNAAVQRRKRTRTLQSRQVKDRQAMF